MLLIILDNEIDGMAFLELSEDDVKGLVSKVGVVKHILRLQKTIMEDSPVRYIFVYFFPELSFALFRLYWQVQWLKAWTHTPVRHVVVGCLQFHHQQQH